jgi:hypothetical protein
LGSIDEAGEGAPSMFVADLIQDEGELLDGGDDNLLAGAQKPA